MRKDFLNGASVQTMKGKIDTLELINFKDDCSWKDTIKKREKTSHRQRSDICNTAPEKKIICIQSI